MFYRIIFINLFFLLNANIIWGQYGPDVDQSVKLSASLDIENTEITLHWIVDSRSVSFDLYRRRLGENSWGSKIADFDTGVDQYVDSDIESNVIYEYKMQKYTTEDVDGFGYLYTGIEVAPVHQSGKVIIIITENTFENIAIQLTDFQNVLTHDGWMNRLLIIPDTLTSAEVKSHVLDAYAEDSFTSCILLGDVPIPLSGDVSPDGHQSQGGAWAADLYYGDLDGIWTDSTVSTNVSPWPVNHNFPGDGKWDQNVIPSDIEIAVGRIDFSDLPVFQEDEYELLRNYLEKNITYRTKQKENRNRAIVHNINPWIGALGQNGIRNFSTLVGPQNIEYENYSDAWNHSYTWLYAASSGFHNSLFMVTKSEDFATKSLNAVFTAFFGSRFGNYDYEDNLMRSALGSGDVLTSCWAGAPHWYFHPMAMGFPIGYSALLSQNNDTVYVSGDSQRSIHVNLLGDPTLKMYPMQSVNQVQASEELGCIKLEWQTQDDAEGYYVYRKKIEEESFELLNVDPVATNSYQDDCPELNQTYQYLVRATRLEVSPSGSYYNLSAGDSDTIQATLDYTPVADFELIFEGEMLILLDNSENAESIDISGVDQVIDQGNGSYLLEGYQNGDVIVLTAVNKCATDTVSQEIVISSIEVLPKNEISVFPNPASQRIHIRSIHPILKWKIYDAQGQLVQQGINDKAKFSINIMDLSTGIYRLSLNTREEEMIKTVVVE